MRGLRWNLGTTTHKCQRIRLSIGEDSRLLLWAYKQVNLSELYMYVFYVPARPI